VKTAAQAAQNWSGASGRATTAYDAGVQAYTGDWASATVAQQPTMVNNWTQAVSGGLWARGVQAVGTAGWKSATQAKQTNYTTGYSAGATNFSAAIQKIISYESTVIASLPPRGDINQNLQRANAFALAMHSQKGNLGAR
jgi:hypothetical protein